MLKFEPFYQEYERTLDAFSLAFSTIYFEQMTIAPKKGIPYSNEMLSRLSKQAFIIENDPETIQKIKEYAKTLPEGSLEKKEVDYRLEALAQSENIPSDVYANYVKVKADSELAWHEAKEADNYEHFKPHLQAIMKETLHLLEYDPKFNGNNAYDVLLDRYEKGMTQEQLGGKMDRSQAWISKLERGDRKMSIEMLYSIANSLECSIYEILPNNKEQRNGK